ncbi:MAG: zinc ribbon domain-containing protein [Oscillospiraceae bacterium]|nr:zinc ribbon domain-containing protein [Oscillospiraceae bacterium]MDO5138488.1 zinc ribbon domain-containing protein [Oscillospiraceae bacterium]
MAKHCVTCGALLPEDALFCEECGTPVHADVPLDDMPKDRVLKDDKGTYRWIYELNMLKSMFLLVEVWKVIAMAAAVVCIFMLLVGVFSGDGISAAVGAVETCLLVLGILFVLSVPSYYIVTKANNGKYTVLFEMDDEGIDHTQIKTDKAKALELLALFVGGIAKSRGATASAALSASGGSLYSRFSKVKKVKAYPKKNLIRVNGTLIHNQVYVRDEDFDFVYQFIVDHCPNAKIG